jgi:S1-C subfamily serine protease
MNAALKSLVFASLFVVFAGVANVADGQVRARLRLYPGPSYPGPSIPETPQLGIYGHFEWSYGMVVDDVLWGTPASRMGLEPGDVILAVNGCTLRSEYDYFRALRYGGNYARLVIQDVRTGTVVSRTALLGGSGGIYRGGRLASFDAGLMLP